MGQGKEEESGVVAADPLVGRTVGGAYAVAERIGAGAMGVVYRARHELLGREFAVKALAPHLVGDPQVRRRFVAEARSLLAVDHPGVVRVRHFFEEDGRLFLVMDLCPGRPLAAVLADEGRIAEPRAVGIAVQLLEALDAVHLCDVVHRDLKPSNVMVVGAPGSEVVRILDFGLARIVGAGASPSHATSASAPGGVVGTVPYMAPEQLRGDPDVDRRADLFSVGVILHEMLSGALPFTGDSSISVALEILQGEPAPLPSGGAHAVSAPTRRVIERALAKSPADRFCAAGEFAEALRDALAGRAPPQVRAAAARRVGASRRSPGPVARKVAGGAALAAAVWAAVAWWSFDPDEAALGRARALLETDPWAARDEANRLWRAPRPSDAAGVAARAAILEGDAFRSIRTRSEVRDVQDLCDRPDQAYARALRLAIATAAEPEALARLGEELERTGRSADACSVFKALEAAFSRSEHARRVTVARARAEFSTGRGTEATQSLAGLDAGAATPDAGRLARLIADMKPLTAFGTDATASLCAGDLDGDGRGEIVMGRARDVVVLGLSGGELVVRAATAMPMGADGRPIGGVVTWGCLFRPTAGGPPHLAVATRGAEAVDRLGALAVFRFDGAKLEALGPAVPVGLEARPFAADLRGGGGDEILVCHAGGAGAPVDAFEIAPGSRALQAVPIALDAGAEQVVGFDAVQLDVFSAVPAGPRRLVLATGYWRMLGAATATVVPGDPTLLRVEPAPRDANVEGAASDGEGGVAFTVSHRATTSEAMLGLQTDVRPPGLRHRRPDGSELAVLEDLRTIARVGTGGTVHAPRNAHFFALAAWRREGRLRWILRRQSDDPSNPTTRPLVLDDVQGAAPAWLELVGDGYGYGREARITDVDGDGRDDVVLFDPGRGQIVLAGVRARDLRGAPPASVPVRALQWPQSGGRASRLLFAAAALRALGFHDEAVAAWEDVLRIDTEGALTRDAVESLVGTRIELGQFEAARTLLETDDVVRRVPASRRTLLRARTWEAQGQLGQALTLVRSLREVGGAPADDQDAARAIETRLAGRVPGDETSVAFGTATIGPASNRVDLIEAIDVGTGDFTLSCQVRFVNFPPGAGLGIAAEGDLPMANPSLLGGRTRIPFTGVAITNQRIAPALMALRDLQSEEPGGDSVAHLYPDALRRIDAATSYDLELCSVHTGSQESRIWVRIRRTGEDQREFRAAHRAPLRAGGRRNLRIWLFRYEGEADAVGTSAEVRDVRVTVWPPR